MLHVAPILAYRFNALLGLKQMTFSFRHIPVLEGAFALLSIARLALNSALAMISALAFTSILAVPSVALSESPVPVTRLLSRTPSVF